MKPCRSIIALWSRINKKLLMEAFLWSLVEGLTHSLGLCMFTIIVLRQCLTTWPMTTRGVTKNVANHRLSGRVSQLDQMHCSATRMRIVYVMSTLVSSIKYSITFFDDGVTVVSRYRIDEGHPIDCCVPGIHYVLIAWGSKHASPKIDGIS